MKYARNWNILILGLWLPLRRVGVRKEWIMGEGVYMKWGGGEGRGGSQDISSVALRFYSKKQKSFPEGRGPGT